MIVLSHAGNLNLFIDIKGTGQIGVMLFFSLSGFLMSYLYGSTYFDLKKLISFGLKRFFRVYPLYLFVVSSSFVLHTNYGEYLYDINSLKQLIKHLIFIEGINIFWVIPVEMKFYLIFPFIALMLSWMTSKKHRVYASLIIYIAALLIEAKQPKISVWPYLDFFAGGVCAGYIYPLLLPNNQNKQRMLAANILFILSVIGIIILIPNIFHALFGFHHRLWHTSISFSILTSSCVLLCAMTSGIIERIFSNIIISFIGKISFSLYLVHIPCLKFVKNNFNLSQNVELGLGIIVSISIAYFLFLLIETPSKSLGKTIITYFTDRKNNTNKTTPPMLFYTF